MKKNIGISSYLSLFFGLLLSFGIYLFVANLEDAKVKSLFTFHAKTRFNDFQTNIDQHIHIIKFIDGLFKSSSHVSRKEFKDFIAIALQQNTSILGFSWNPLIKKDERQTYEQKAKEDGFTKFEINESHPTKGRIKSPIKKEYLPVYYIEPHLNNEKVLGFNIASNKSRLKTVRQARDSGNLAVSERVSLVQEHDKTYAFLIMKAIYKNGKTLKTKAQRQKHFQGVIVAVLSFKNLISGTLKKIDPAGIDILLTNNSATKDKQFIYKHQSRTRLNLSNESLHQESKLLYKRDMNLLGQKLTFSFIASPKFFQYNHSWNAFIFLLIGLTISFLLFIYLRNKIQTHINLEQKVKERTYELEIATRTKSQFLANMSHEIRTPLNAIVGFVDILYKSESDQSKQSKLKIIKESGRSLLTIINDILDFSKLEHNKLSIENLPYNVKELFAQTVELYFSPAKEKSITIKHNQEKEIPSFILGDPTRVKQVISNLLSNALKFSKDKSEVIINLKVKKETNELLCEIIDKGIGIDAKAIKKIFSPFLQADNSTTRKFGGTGLGLSISKTLIELMNGKLEVKSKLGTGSTFSFTLPIRMAQTPDELEDETKEHRTLKGRVLIVEDNLTNQLLLKILLSELNLEADTVNDGSQSIEAIKKYPYDIILMDENMPILNGTEATKVIRTLDSGKEVPIIAVTANALKGDREKFLACGMNDYLSKPIDPNKLYQVLSKYL